MNPILMNSILMNSMKALLIPATCLLLAPTPAEGQNPQPQQGAPAQAGPPAQAEPVVELVFLRETFTYPSFTRRNPFVPLTSASEGAPRFEQMRLVGIVFSESAPSESIATLYAGAVGGQQQAAPPQAGGGGAAGRSARLRVGERWGNVRVREIYRDYIVVEVTEFGLLEVREMRTQARGQGGS